jgi:1-phosphofructokinase
MNPCVDYTVSVHDLRVGGTNRIIATRRDTCGKGINVSVALHKMGLSTLCLGISHGDGVLKSFLEESGIPYDLADAPGRIRTNIKLFDEKSRVMTECNERGDTLPAEVLEQVRCMIDGHLKKADLLVLNGSVPPGVPDFFYHELALKAKGAGVPVLMDASGPLLRAGVQAAPMLIKPNRDELLETFGVETSDIGIAVHACRELALRYGVLYIALSMGEDGALLVSRDSAWYSRGATIQVRGLQGAGDSMIAGFCMGFSSGVTDGKVLLRLAVAAAGASLEKSGTQMCSRADIDRLLPSVQAELISI